MPSTENSISARISLDTSSMSSGVSFSDFSLAPGIVRLRFLSKNLRLSSGFMRAKALR